ncbi:hypothetical protein Vadar_024893 [Vaccinium darrowii]|uniref:Uncharacterized protein n=1 Tax=Vaccinium darrowii TaxID=229202 RepID=A0ACB7YFX1_9ERIC|nr:hypothetical protein Vadar_024893 [Vaccinium darrowii]
MGARPVKADSVQLLPEVAYDGTDMARVTSRKEIEAYDDLCDATLKKDACRAISKKPWHEALEILQLGPFCHKIRSDAIKAIAIYCPNLRKFRLSGIRDINGDAINAPAKHCLSFIKIGFVDCHNIDEVAVSNVVPLQFLSVAGTTRMNWGLVSQNWTKLPNFICL